MLQFSFIISVYKTLAFIRMSLFKSLNNYILIGCLLLGFASCSESESIEPRSLKTENVFVAVIDGARYSETWGDPGHEHIPQLYNLISTQGVSNTDFRHNGLTKTVPGHVAITTGIYEELNNSGEELPQKHSFLQEWLKHSGSDSTSALIIGGKDKLQVLSNCLEPEWKDQYNPMSHCGKEGKGLGSGFQNDSLTFTQAKELIFDLHPQITLISFLKPDSAGHDNNWDEYLQRIKESDQYITELWTLIQNDPIYKDKTTLIITNDHGRHLDNVADGFVSHGDTCEGCTHLNFMAIGPDFHKGLETNVNRDLADIPATVARLLDFSFPYGSGEIMNELFTD